MNLINRVRNILLGDTVKKKAKDYFCKYEKYSFVDCACESSEQFQASVIRLYHTIEKGLSYTKYRPGFGRDNIEKLVFSLEQYCEMGYDCSAFFYETALSCLKAYIEKNKAYGLEDNNLEKRVNQLPGHANECGGTIAVSIPSDPGKMNYEQLMLSRHSIRHFSNRPVDIPSIVKAIELAQHTPSACNRQGWKTRIINDRAKVNIVLANQNGNRGFGQELNKILIITADLRAQQRNREVFQAFIDGGMYAESVLNALYYYGIGSVTLSASLTQRQEKIIRGAIGIDDAEVLILFIGIGNYPDEDFLTTRSERRMANVHVI